MMEFLSGSTIYKKVTLIRYSNVQTVCRGVPVVSIITIRFNFKIPLPQLSRDRK